MNENPDSFSFFRHWPLILSLLAAAFLYGSRLNSPLIWDDYGAIVLNEALDRPFSLGHLIGPEYFSFSKEQSWRPLATASYALAVKAAGKSPWVFRISGLLIHGLNGFLIFALLRSFGIGLNARLWACAFFLIHPAHSETLMCAAFNEEILAAFGILVMLLAHRHNKVFWACAGFAFSLLSKETGVLGLPLAALSDVLCPARASSSPEGERKGRIWAYCVYGLVLSLYLWARFFYLKGPGAEGGLSSLLPPGERLYYCLQGFVSAFRIFFLPFSLRIEYFALPPGSAVELFSWIAGGVLISFSLAWAFYYFRRNDRAMIFFLLWPFLFLAVTSNALPVELLSLRVMAERWLYLPFIGLAAVSGYLVSQKMTLPAKFPLLLLVFWAGLGLVRVKDWAEEPRLWKSLIRIYPWSAKAHEGLGEAYYRRRSYPEALESFEEALSFRESRKDKVLAHYVPLAKGRLSWESPSLYRWLGLCRFQLEDMAGAEKYFSKAVSLQPSAGFAYRVLGYGFARSGNFVKARDWTKRGLAQNPDDEFLLRLKPDVSRRRLSFQADFY